MHERRIAFSKADRQALLRKYRQLATWRRARDRDPDAAVDRAALRALALEFPGALRELDTLGEAELDRRIQSLEAPVGLEPVETWMVWIVTYHRWMRAALDVKARLGGRRRVDEATRRALSAAASQAAGVPVDGAFVDAIAHPPHGRLSQLVLAHVARTLDAPSVALANTLFPPRRRRIPESL